jgi:hypothetical protein
MGSVHMETALTPAQCDFMQTKLRQIVELHKTGAGINDILREIRRDEAGQVNIHNPNKYMSTCLECGKVTPSNRNKKWCDIKCYSKYKRRQKNVSNITG